MPGREAEVVAAEGAHLSPVLSGEASRRRSGERSGSHPPPPAGGGFELTGREFGHGSAGARDISRAGLEQRLDKMESLFG